MSLVKLPICWSNCQTCKTLTCASTLWSFHFDWVQILPNKKSNYEPWLSTIFLISNWRGDLQLGDELVFIWIGPVWHPESILEDFEIWTQIFWCCAFFVFCCLFIVFVWSQYDGGNIEQRTKGYGCHQNQRSLAKDCGRRLYLDPTNKIFIQPFTI